MHPIGSGVELGDCTLHDLATPKAIADSIRSCARAHSDLPWVRGSGWQLPVFKDANPSKSCWIRLYLTVPHSSTPPTATPHG